MAARKQSGGASMTAAGKKPMQLWFTPEEMEVIRQAAEADGRPMTGLMAHYGLQAAKKILQKSAKAG